MNFWTISAQKCCFFFFKWRKKSKWRNRKFLFWKSLKSKESLQKIKCFLWFRLVNFLVLLKHILLKKEHDLLVFQLFVSKHFYEYFFLILRYVFVTLKFWKWLFSLLFCISWTQKVFWKKSFWKFRLQNLQEFFQIWRLFSRKIFWTGKIFLYFFSRDWRNFTNVSGSQIANCAKIFRFNTIFEFFKR